MQNKINNKWQWLRLIFLLLNILFPLRMAFAAGGIATDGTVGPAQTLSGTNVTIPQNLGTTFGKNLFHSFNQFNVNNGQTVTFTENTPNALENVISRVTGGSASNIDGTLRSTPGGRANLYLVNPSGIVFGKNAQINVPGAFHASTADEVRFQDGARFSASQPAGSNLTAAAPASFGFLGTSSATNGLLKVDGAQLAVGTGKKLDMVGRNISVENGAKLTAPEGEVRLEAVGQGSMTVPLNQPSETAHGALALTKSTIDASGEGGGKVIIRGSDLNMDQNAKILAETKDKKDGVGIDVHLTGNLTMKDGSKISASTFGSGDAGNIFVTAKNLLLDGKTDSNGQKPLHLKTSIDSESGDRRAMKEQFTGSAGNIELHIADRLSLVRGGRIGASSFGKGDAGKVIVNAGELLIDEQGVQTDSLGNQLLTGIFAGSGKTWSGKGGDINVTVQNDIYMKGGSEISAVTRGSKAAGNIHIKAKNLLIDGQTTLNRQNIYFPTLISSTSGSDTISDKTTGNAGHIEVNIANRLSLLRGGQIGTSSFNKGNAGKVIVNTGELLIDEQGVQTDSLGNQLQTGIFTAAGRGWSGKGGDINVTVQGNMTMKGGSVIGASTHSSGAAGNIYVTASNLAVDGRFANGQTSTLISSIAVEGETSSEKTGNAGNITLDIANQLSLIRGGKITTSSFGTGNAGDIVVNARQLLIDGQGILTDNFFDGPLETGIFTGAQGVMSGQGGDITTIIQGNVNVRDGGRMRASTLGRGTAGDINVKAKNIFIEGQSPDATHQSGIITATASRGSGNAGDIVLKASEDISISGNSQLFSSTIGSQVRAGNISLTARNFEASLGAIIDSSNFAAEGGSGDIIIRATDSFHIYGKSLISSLTLGVGRHGKIDIKSPSLNITDHARIFGTTVSDGTGSDIILTGKDIRIDSAEIRSESRNIKNPFTGKIAQGAGGNIDISASNHIYLSQKGVISSGSTSWGNAGNITLNANQLSLDQDSSISSEADNSNGGNITINGGQLVQLINSGLRTSVHGPQIGNSGNITINAKNLVMETGLIQANTRALGASAGNIKLNIKGLIPSGQSLFRGVIQETPWKPDEFGLNVIEAVAPNGISGLVQSTAPQLDLSGVLSNLGMPQFDVHAISQNYCSLGAGSSLIRQGKGGLPPRSRDSVMY